MVANVCRRMFVAAKPVSMDQNVNESKLDASCEPYV